MTKTYLLLGLIGPVVLCALSVVIGWRLWRPVLRSASARGYRGVAGRVLTSLVLAIGAVGAAIAVHQRPPIPPTATMSINHWVAYLAVAFGALGVITSIIRLPAWLRGTVIGLISAGASWVIMRPLIGGHYGDTVEGWIWTAVLAAIMTVMWNGLDAATRVGSGGKGGTSSGAAGAWIVAAVAGIGAPVLILWGSIGSAQVLGSVAAMVGVVGAAALLRPRVTLAGGPVMVAAPMICVLAAMTSQYSDELPHWGSAVLLVVACWAWVVGDLPVIRQMKPWIRGVVRVAAVAAVMGGALVVAVLDAPVDEYMKFAR